MCTSNSSEQFIPSHFILCSLSEAQFLRILVKARITGLQLHGDLYRSPNPLKRAALIAGLLSVCMHSLVDFTVRMMCEDRVVSAKSLQRLTGLLHSRPAILEEYDRS